LQNIRTVTAFILNANADSGKMYGFATGLNDRLFFLRSTLLAGVESDSLFWLSTNSPNASPVEFFTSSIAAGVQFFFANDNHFLWTRALDQMGFLQFTAYAVPLPSGLPSGGPDPIFLPGKLDAGVIDQDSFFGRLPSLPVDAIGRCSIADCSNPTALFRGHENSTAFAQDTSAFYWTTPGLSTTGNFTVWKVAK
jgi:hypothetical protein